MLDKDVIETKVFTDWRYYLSFGFGSGLLPYAPGTWGSIMAFLVYFILSPFPTFFYLLATIILFFWGVYFCSKVGEELGIHDYGGIVWDEVIGILITLFYSPHYFLIYVLAFLLFRIFDIWKPFPIRLLDTHIKGGFGVMIDDVLAGVYAFCVLQLLIWGFSL